MEYCSAMENHYHVTTISQVATWIGVRDIMLGGKKASSGNWVLWSSSHIPLVKLQKYGREKQIGCLQALRGHRGWEDIGGAMTGN